MSEFVPNDAVLTMSLEGQAVGSIANNLTTTDEGFALDARQGKVLDDKKLDKTRVANNLGTIVEGWALDARQGKYLDENKVGFSDIANNLTTDNANKVLSAVQGKVLSEKNAELANRATALESRAGALESTAASLDKRTGALETKTVSLERRAGALETKSKSLESRAGTLESRAGALETRAGSLESKDASLATRIGALETTAQNLDQKIDQKTDQVSAKIPSFPLAVSLGGTGANSASGARTNLGITPANIGAVTMKTATASLPVSGWSNNQQTVSVSGVTTGNTVIVTAAPASYAHYNECAVRCSAQASGKLTFTCTDKPTSNLTANVLILT